MGIITTIEPTDPAALVRLMTWLSPAFPVGAFAYSGGLEKVIEDGRVLDGSTLNDWLASLLSHGFLKTDAILFSLSYRAGDSGTLIELSNLAAALAGSAERQKETMALGGAFLTAASAWPCQAVDWLGARAAYPVAAGAVAGSHNVGLEAALSAYLHAAISQLVSVAIRCGVIGQSQGVGLLASLEKPILEAASTACGATLDDLGSATIRADIASMRHETQVTRLFRS
ncbi:urease accessory protein UreF [Rhizobium sp. L1K21]|uniref:urease accessory protein UreF n=1 Tax=Rhizobium sp. L1K21 TaxID=2954933 RepID=UPI002092C4E5|nr:urease accessory protein UreF [Rhizobium sp. L1K21]MCO6185326.1 urease accessory protein UreF [Rhizobium sp. L1K21]